MGLVNGFNERLWQGSRRSSSTALPRSLPHLRERPAQRLAAMASRSGAPSTSSVLSMRGSKAATRSACRT